jgi:pimeloyl-ACP methyl ester carboxylesterase
MSALPPLWREARFPAELRGLQRDPVSAGVGVPRGDGEPILLIPGFLAGDASLATMTFWLRRLGYRTGRAGITLNTDCSSAVVARLEERLERAGARHGRRVAIIGQSRGGCLARALANRRPDLVSGIVTLGAPLLDQLALHPLVLLNVRLVGALGALGVPGVFTPDCIDGACCAELRERYAGAFPDDVGFVSIFSRSDGIVDWRACLDPDAEHVHADASHCGMAVNADVYRAVATALEGFRLTDGDVERNAAA